MALKDVQTRLKAAGLYTGLIDGRYGPGTEAALLTVLDRAGIAALVGPVPPKTPVVVNPTVEHPQYTIESFIQHFIETWEGGLSLDPKDSGNFYKGKLVGSKYGVTAAALAKYRNVSNITAADIASLKLSEAVAVGLELYYDEPDFDLMPWDPVVASVMDMGWGAGPVQAVKLLQRMVVCADDGHIGPRTVAAYEDYVVEHGLRQTAIDWCNIRYAFYDLIIARKPSNAKYRNGWRNRSAGFLPDTPFWRQWNLPAANR